MNMGKSNLDIFSETLLKIARQDRDIVVLTSDSRGSGRLQNFFAELPDQAVEIGIAEQNLVGVAAGLASAGKKVFAVSPACFLTARGLEQIKNDVAYSNLPVRLVGISAGVSYGALGSTHHSLHDLAVLQAIHNIDIVIPADNYETRETILAAWRSTHPMYIRFGKKAMPHLPKIEAPFEIGRARVLSYGTDITLVAAGETVCRAVEAAQILTSDGISCGVISLPTLRPFDDVAVLEAARHSQAILTVEEHSIHGGLGSRCAGLLLEAGVFRHFKIVGIPDEDTVTGSQDEIFAHYGITADGLAWTARQVLSRVIME
jgi:transketolase